MLQIKVGQEVDGKIVDKITINEDTREMTFFFGKHSYKRYVEKGYAFTDEMLVLKENQSIETILNHKWEN